MPKNKKLALKLGIQTYQIFTNDDEVCIPHTPYSWNIMCQKWEGDCGLWVLNELFFKKFAESLKKNLSTWVQKLLHCLLGALIWEDWEAYLELRKNTNKKSMALWEKTHQKRKEWYLILTRITSKLLLNNALSRYNTHKNKSY